MATELLNLKQCKELIKDPDRLPNEYSKVMDSLVTHIQSGEQGYIDEIAEVIDELRDMISYLFQSNCKEGELDTFW